MKGASRWLDASAPPATEAASTPNSSCWCLFLLIEKTPLTVNEVGLLAIPSIPAAHRMHFSKTIPWTTPCRSASLRARHFGTAPLVEDNSAKSTPYTTVDLQVGIRHGNQWTAVHGSNSSSRAIA